MREGAPRFPAAVLAACTMGLVLSRSSSCSLVLQRTFRRYSVASF